MRGLSNGEIWWVNKLRCLLWSNMEVVVTREGNILLFRRRRRWRFTLVARLLRFVFLFLRITLFLLSLCFFCFCFHFMLLFWSDFFIFWFMMLLLLFEKLWKRICAETTTEIYLLAENWKYLLAGLICQVLIYVITSFSICCFNQYIYFSGYFFYLVIFLRGMGDFE